MPPPTPADPDHDPEIRAARARAAALSEALTGTVDVLVDGSGRLGPLSYLVPDELVVRPGLAVEVPFGKRKATGVVLGPGRPEKATRELLGVWGERVTPDVLATAELIAARHFEPVERVVPRLVPAKGKSGAPLGDLDVELAEPLPTVPDLEVAPDETGWRRFVARPAGRDPADHAAAVAAELSTRGQVLVICPTKALVGQVEARFAAGARRLDSDAERGAWRGFLEGHITVGIGTRAAALFSAPRLAAVVVVEQDHPALVESSMPYTHARDVALLRSLVCDTPVVFTGAVPTPAALSGGVKLVNHEPGVEWPRMTLADTSERTGRVRLLPPEVTAAVRAARDAGERALVVVERKRAIHRCTNCGVERTCPHCPSASVCSHTPGPCADCGSRDTKVVGWDAARLESLFGHRVTAVEPKDLARRRNAGTVVIFDVDAPARRPGLAPDQAVLSLVAAAALAAGPDGHVVAMTRGGVTPLLHTVFRERDVRAAAKVLWRQARQFGLPPFGRLVTITVGRQSAPAVRGWPGSVHGPRQVRDQEWEVLVRIAPDQLQTLDPVVARLRRGGRTRITVT